MKATRKLCALVLCFALLLTLAFAATRRRAAREATLRRISELNAAARELLAGLPLPGGARSFCTVPAEAASPFILHLTLPGVQSGVVVRMLSEEDVMVAAGSACASETRTPSAALTALGFARTRQLPYLVCSAACALLLIFSLAQPRKRRFPEVG